MTVTNVDRTGLIHLACDQERNSGGPETTVMAKADAQWLADAGNLEFERDAPARSVDAGVKAVVALRAIREAIRRAESQRVFGHPGASIPAPVEGRPEYGEGSPPTLEEEVRAVLDTLKI